MVSLPPSNLNALEQVCAENGVEWCQIGVVAESRFTAGGIIDLPLSEIEHAWRSGLEDRL